MFSSLFLAVVTYLAAAVDAGVAKKENSEKSFIEIPKGRLKCIIDWKGRKKERERERGKFRMHRDKGTKEPK